MHRRAPPEIQNLKAFYDWLLEPIVTQIALTRSEMADLRKEVFRRFRTVETQMSVDTDRIAAKLAELTDPMASVEALIQQLVDLVRTGGGDPAATDAILATIEGQKTRLATMALANTPAAVQ